MLVTVLGKKVVSYRKKNSEQIVEGISLYYAAAKVGVEGLCTDTLWIKKDIALYKTFLGISLDQPLEVDVIYEMQPGSRYPVLTDIKIVNRKSA